jgi:Na+/H+ antiporter NhaD/arsenite permease-like protein
MRSITIFAALLFLSGSTGTAFAATGLDGASLGLVWLVPFAGLLLSIALGPLLFAHLWEHHYGKFALGWSLLTIVPLALVFGPMVSIEQTLHALIAEYLSFIIMLFALFAVAGGIFLRGNLHGSAGLNTLLLVIGTVLASFVGTTGASMILIRPLIRANDNRRTNVHVVIFFIFLVSNIGGGLTPLGDPPLFVGFLRGIDFFWPLSFLWFETLFVAAVLLVLFFLLDSYFWRRDVKPQMTDPTPDSRIRLFGLINLPIIAIMISAILLSASWKPGISFAYPGGTVQLENLVRDIVLVACALASLLLTPRMAREGNGFNWHPILEVAKLFAGIFVCMIPVLAILKAGESGVFAPLIQLVSNADGTPNPFAYFWLTGILSSFLDNAPTYLVFFELAGGNPTELMGPLAATLAAISTGAVFMGANTYIGNAPNFMVYAVARNMGVKMPSFFGYMLWSGAILLPLFVVTSLIFF